MTSCEHVRAGFPCAGTTVFARNSPRRAGGKSNNPFVRDVEPLPVADGPEF